MPKLTESKVPSYRLHKQSGQAIVTLSGRDVLLGKHNTAASKVEYNRLIGEWVAAGRRYQPATPDLSISELICQYKAHCESYYRRPDGSSTGEAEAIKMALRALRKLYGATVAAEFSPLKLKTVREAMIDPKLIDPNYVGNGWSRKSVNKNVSRIRGMFRWATENELISATVLHGLRAVAGLKMGRTEAREAEPVKPVPDTTVDRTLPHLTTIVSAMVRFQRFTGVRPGEVCQIRTGDIDRTAAVWTYRPGTHKTAHHGHKRTIAIGPRAQAVLQPFLKPLNPTAYIFSPADAAAEVREQRTAARKTPLSCGNRIGTNRTRKPKRKPGDRYTTTAYRRAIARGCDSAFPPPKDLGEKEREVWQSEHRWHPHQLRHSAATEIRRRFGLESAQVFLGHAKAGVTEIYAERDQTAASRIAAEVG